MKDCTGKEITMEWLYHLGVPEALIEDYATNSAICIPTMMPYITAFFMPRRKEDRPDVIAKDAINFAFLGQFAHTPRGYCIYYRIFGKNSDGSCLWFIRC